MPPAATTTALKPPTAESLPDPQDMPGRPDDADSLAALLAWSASALWPDGVQDVPHRTAPLFVGGWANWNAPPGPTAADRATHLLTVLGHAEATALVDPDGDYFGGFAEGNTYLFDVDVDGVPVVLASWEYLRQPDPIYRGQLRPDTPDLWRWSAARRDDGPASTAAAARTLAGALQTAQAIHDALTVLLPQVEDEPPTSGPSRLGKW